MRGCIKKLALFAAILTAIVMLVAVTTWVYWYRGEQISDQAWNAYYEGKPAEALASYRTIKKQYPSFSFFEDIVLNSYYKVPELEDYLQAISLQDSGKVNESIVAYESFLEKHHPNYHNGNLSINLYLSLARENLATLKLVQAQAFRGNEEYANAIGVYQSVLELRFHGGDNCVPQDQRDIWGAACRQADDVIEDSQAGAQAAIPEVFIEWDRALAQEKDYEEYIKKYQAILRIHRNLINNTQAQVTLDRIYREWADHLREMEDCEGRIETYQSTMQGYPDRLSRNQAKAILAEMYYEWATQLRKMRDYKGAIGKYEIVVEEYPDSPSGLQAKATMAEIYSEWAIQLREAEEYEKAIEKYQIILREYPSTSSAAQAETAMAETYDELAIWQEENPAIPVADFPKEVNRDSDGRWSWTIVFGEKGGTVGYSLSGEGWIVDTKGARYGSWGSIIDRGSLTVPAGGWAEDSYWVRGDTFIGGYAAFTWSGEDDNGHPITFEEKVHLLP